MLTHCGPRLLELLIISDPALSVRPKYDQLIELLESLVNWEKFGAFLPGIKSEHIQVIEYENRRIDQQKNCSFFKMA